jgi:hypothetical protein
MLNEREIGMNSLHQLVTWLLIQKVNYAAINDVVKSSHSEHQRRFINGDE